MEYLKLARELPGYGEVVFPHCACDSRKEGHVIVSVGTEGIKLHACREDGTPESQVVSLRWDCIRQWEVDEEGKYQHFLCIKMQEILPCHYIQTIFLL